MTALVILVLVEPIDGVPCFHIGYAVVETSRNQGAATQAVLGAIAELRNGLGRAGPAKFCIEAMIGTDNKASQRVVEKTGFPAPKETTDEVSGSPALQYVLYV